MGAEARLFLGVPLSDGVRDRLSTAVAEAPERGFGGRSIPPENWHITLRFLGPSTVERTARFMGALDAADRGAVFRISLRGWGAFPRPRRATVLWVGVEDPTGGLARLAEVSETAARSAGYPPEQRPFRPHLTVGRSRAPVDLSPILAALPPIDIPLEAGRLVLFRSTLGGPAPVYTPIRSILLPHAETRHESL
jgi:RNA 2',3'-cyclic 3'-phosphodiesterase